MNDVLNNNDRLAALYELNLVDTLGEEAFDRYTKLASHILNVPVSLVSFVESHRQFFKSYIGLEEPIASTRETPLSHSFCQHVVINNQPLIVEDATQHNLVKDNLAVTEHNVQSYLGIPIVLKNGLVLGSFCVHDSKPRKWSANDIETMTTLAQGVMAEINLRYELKQNEKINHLLENRNEELSAFTHTVSHNLKTPLNGMIGTARLALHYTDRYSYDDLLETISDIESSGMKAQDTINALLTLSSVGLHQLPDVNALDMVEIIKFVLERLNRQIIQKQAMINIQMEMPASIGYAPWVEEVWMNYVSNALKYGGNPPLLEFGARADNHDVRYWIKDNGEGIAPEQLDKLYIPFTRLVETADIEGHGLGLSIVQRIVERLGGTVGVESQLGEGSTFYFTLPLK